MGPGDKNVFKLAQQQREMIADAINNMGLTWQATSYSDQDIRKRSNFAQISLKQFGEDT